MRTSIPDSSAQSLRFLPRDRKTLDYILSRLAVNSSPERYDLLAELFEMHRTSVGFDPSVLSKGRFKRFKAFEIRQVLVELEQDLSLILSSDEYAGQNETITTYKDLFNQYLTTVELLSAPPSKSLNDQVDAFCKMLVQEGAYELLLSFYRQGHHHFTSRNVRIDQVITDYRVLIDTLDFHNAFILTGLESIQLINNSYQGNSTQEELLLHLNTLKKLIQQTTENVSLFELKGRAVRIAQLLDRSATVINELTNDIFTARQKGIIANDDLEAELICAAALYDNTLPVNQRLEILSIQSSSKLLSAYRIIHTKLTEAILLAASDNLTQARIHLNAAEHLLIKNSFRSIQMKKLWMELHVLRFFIYISEELQEISVFEKAEYQILIQAVRETGDEIKEAMNIADALQSIMHCIKIETEISSALMDEWLEIARNENVLKTIVRFFSLTLSEKTPAKKLLASVNAIEEMKEPFYSDVFCGVLKKMISKNK
ncbi:MAG: hypothetical protein ABI772_02765 [Bacteroidota bacterium]